MRAVTLAALLYGTLKSPSFDTGATAKGSRCVYPAGSDRDCLYEIATTGRCLLVGFTLMLNPTTYMTATWVVVCPVNHTAF